MNNKNEIFDPNANESLAQIEQTMRSMIAMAKNGHFPFLTVVTGETSKVLSIINTLSLISPHKSKKVLYNSLVKCRRHKCFKRKMMIIQNLSFDEKAQLVKALVTLAADSKMDDGLIIH